MNTITLIIIGILGIIIGSYFGSRKGDVLISEQSKQKQENKQKILEFLKSSESITNNDVERLCGVSHNTAERYLNELEKEGKLIQNGKTGQSVFYTLK